MVGLLERNHRNPGLDALDEMALLGRSGLDDDAVDLALHQVPEDLALLLKIALRIAEDDVVRLPEPVFDRPDDAEPEVVVDVVHDDRHVVRAPQPEIPRLFVPGEAAPRRKFRDPQPRLLRHPPVPVQRQRNRRRRHLQLFGYIVYGHFHSLF